MKRTILNIIFIAIAIVAKADKVGTWKLYPSYNNVQEVQDAGNDIYVLASGNLFSYSKSDETLTEYMKEGAESATGHSIDCLSSSDITHIAWVSAAKKLVIVYSDGMIDLMDKDANVGHVTAIKSSTENFNKTVDSIYVSGKYAILQTAETDSFSINLIKLDVSNEVIAKSYKVKDTIPDLPARSVTPTAKTIPAYTYAKPEGPASNYCWRLYKHDGKIFSTSGNYSANMSNTLMHLPGEVDYLEDGTWHQLKMPTGYLCANVMAFDQNDINHFWVGGLYGLLEYKDYTSAPTQYLPESSNSLSHLRNTAADARSVITSMTVDASNNLWMTNGWSDPAIQCLSSTGTWKSYPHASMISYSDNTSMDHQRLFISPTNGLMWWVHHYSNYARIFRYNYQTDQLSSISSFTNQDGTQLDISYTKGITEDNDGNIWICTEKGPLVLSKDDATQDISSFVQPKVNRNDGTGLADYLLSEVTCSVVKFDKAGRKWFATTNGIYVISKDNTEELEHFTTDNSPICANFVYDILIDDKTGVVYFATEKGICSYQSDVTETYGTMNKDNVYAYPNPVTPEYSGNITIMGLTNGCQVKIANAAGQVVHNGTCNGGSYSWDCCDSTGNRVASGVYMVLVSDAEGNDGCVTKIAIIK